MSVVFVTTDVICILVQLAGGAMFGVSAGSDPGEGGIDVNTATNILLAGLALQVGFEIHTKRSVLLGLTRPRLPLGSFSSLSYW